MGEWQVRRARWDDSGEIARFNGMLAQETEGRDLPHELVHQGVRRALERPAHVRYWVAVAGETLIGQAMITPEWSDWRNGWKWWLQSVFVTPDWRGKGVFASLVDFICAEALLEEDPQVVALWLYAEVENARALDVYNRLGFGDAHYKVLDMPRETMVLRASRGS